MSNAKLVDLSHWNGPSDQTKPMVMEWDKAKAAGVAGIIVRLGSINDTTGACYLDSRLLEIVSSAVSAGMPIGYYFYCRPKFSGALQANFILETMSKYNLPLDLDVWYDVEAAAANIAATTASTKQACEILAGAFPGRVGIYTRQSFWDANVAADPLWSKLKLWAARYNTVLTGPWSDGKLKFRDWDYWHFWQWSADGNGLAAAHGFPSGSVSIDLNQYNGDEALFRKAYGLNPLDDVYAKLEELERLIAGLQVGHDALAAADEQLKNRVIALEVEVVQIKTAANIQAEATRLLSGKLDAQTVELVKLVNWAKSINYK